MLTGVEKSEKAGENAASPKKLLEKKRYRDKSKENQPEETNEFRSRPGDRREAVNTTSG